MNGQTILVLIGIALTVGGVLHDVALRREIREHRREIRRQHRRAIQHHIQQVKHLTELRAEIFAARSAAAPAGPSDAPLSEAV